MSKLIPRVKASVSIIPTGSHVVILALVGIMALCLICSFLFVWLGLNYWPPLVFSGILLVVIVFLWFRSHRHVDDKSLPPTELTIKDEITETTISMHPRGLPFNEHLKMWERVISMIQHQRLLPEPDGLVDKNGKVIPQSEHRARQRINVVNREAKQKFNATNTNPNDFDQPNETMQSRLSVEPILGEMKKTNRPGD